MAGLVVAVLLVTVVAVVMVMVGGDCSVRGQPW